MGVKEIAGKITGFFKDIVEDIKLDRKIKKWIKQDEKKSSSDDDRSWMQRDPANPHH